MSSPRPFHADATLAALGYASFDAEGDTPRLVSRPPAWLQTLWPKLKTPGAALPAGASPSLNEFLGEKAHAGWPSSEEAPLRSAPFAATAPGGETMHLEATALTIDGRRALLLHRLDHQSTGSRNAPPEAPGSAASQQHLDAEMQKKEILLHYVAEDVSNALGNIITSLRLVELEQNPLRMRKLLDLAAQAARQQQSVIHRILGSFTEELETLYAQSEAPTGADVHAAIRQAAEAAGPGFAAKRVNLEIPANRLSPAPTGGQGAPRAAIAPTRLERVIANLLANALAVTPAGERVAVRVDDEEDAVRIRVEDGGPPLPEDLREELFGDVAPLPPLAPVTGMRLHYCRLSVENSEGEMGCNPGELGGNSFWLRLPKSLPPR